MNEFRFSTKKVGEGIYAITAVMGEQIYLVLGEENALIIDTGLGIGSLREVIVSITELPLLVINTHGHPDHGGGNGEFEEVMLHQKDADIYFEMCRPEYRRNDIEMQLDMTMPKNDKMGLQPLNRRIQFIDFNTIDLGERVIDVYEAPGHTKGSICLYDRKTGSLFTGDNISMTDTWLHLIHCEPVEVYCDTLERLIEIEDCVQLLPGHPPTPIDPVVIEKKLNCAREILKNPQIGVFFTTFAGRGLKHTEEGVSIIYNPDNIYRRTSDANGVRANANRNHRK